MPDPANDVPPHAARRSRWLLPAGTALAVAIAVIAYFVFDAAALFANGWTVERAREVIRSWGAWGVGASLALMVLHSFLPFPAEVIAIANGMVYGALWGSVITWTGAMLGAVAAFAAGRLVGRPIVERLLSAHAQERIREWSDHSSAGDLLAARLLPVIAFNLINYAAALTAVSWRTFLWTTGLGILPFTVLLCVLGEEMMKMPPAWALVLFTVAAIVVWVVSRLLARRRRAGRTTAEN